MSQRCSLRIVPDAQIPVSNLAIASYRGCFKDDSAESAEGESPVVNQMPFIGYALACRVLAHG